jgi:SprT protein
MDQNTAIQIVRQRVKELTEQVRSTYPSLSQFCVPTVNFTVKGTYGGRAIYMGHIVDFNKQLMLENWDDFDNTVIHEVAHLAAKALHGLKRIRPHGPEWKSVFIRLGGNGRRCHSYDTSSTKIQRTKYTYVCPNCNKTYHVGTKIHNKISILGRVYRCKCKGAIEFLGIKPRDVARTKGTLAHVEAANGLLQRFGSKKLAAAHIICENPTATRRQIIQMFIQQLDMTPAGAGTYYHNITSGKCDL